MEQFKLFHKGPEVFYYIGNQGTLKSFRIKTMKIKELSPCISKTCKSDKQGYLQTQINVNGKNKNFRIHRLVAENFLMKKGPKKGFEVNHKNGNKHDNRAENLEWVHRSENTKHAHDYGLIKSNVKGFIKYNNSRKGKYCGSHPFKKVAEGVTIVRNTGCYKTAAKLTGVPTKVLWHYNKRSEIFAASMK